MLSENECSIKVTDEIDPGYFAKAHIEVSTQYMAGQPLLHTDVVIFLHHLYYLLGGPDVSLSILEALNGCDDGGLLLRP